MPLPAALADALGALGPAAAAVIPALYVTWMLLGIPTAPLGLAAGFTLGSLDGGVVATTGCTAGACAAFLAARWLGRGAVERLATRVPAIEPGGAPCVPAGSASWFAAILASVAAGAFAVRILARELSAGAVTGGPKRARGSRSAP